jgi:HEPN domain-containing protein/predicted nucleotidyltransferase
MADLDLLPAMTERLVRRFAPLQIILFGSQARGDAGTWSDVDLLVVLPEVADTWRTARDMRDELQDLHVPMDITVTSPDEIRRRGNLVGTVLRPALREGRVLYERDRNGHAREAIAVSEGEIAREIGQWLQFAEDEMADAELLASRPLAVTHTAGFLAQQAAEKALKAVYIFLQVQYPLSHNLDELRDGIPEGWSFRDAFPDLKELSLWAVVLRYPGGQASLSLADARRHVRQARALLEAVRRDLGEHGYNA